MAASEGALAGMGSKSDRRSPSAVASQPSTNSASTAQSRRDRKRQALLDRLSSVNEKLQREKDLAYRDQLQKIQLELNLVQRFDPYSDRALETIAELQQDHRQELGAPVQAENARSLMDMAGIRFHEFIDEIEDLIELRDFQLTQSKNEYDRKIQEYKNTHAYKTETAKREHRALNKTLRDRLINTLTQKKNRLNREKEVLEISDSNALLLNPNQFSLTNPASPGGGHAKRATRLRRDAEDMQMFPDSKKRKRNGNGEEDGSPGPTRRALDPNTTTPLWQSEKARVAAKQNGPLYSLDKLFTDKELSFHYNAAAVAAHQYILRNRAQPNGSSGDDSDSGNGDTNDGQDTEDVVAPVMERQISHATRSNRGAANAASNFLDDKILGLEALASMELPGNLDLLHALEPPKMPPPVPQQYLKPYPRTADQNFPVSLSQEDITSDLHVMDLFKQYGHSKKKAGAHLDSPHGGLRKILEAVATPYHQGRYVAFTGAPRDDPESIRESLGLPPNSSLRDQLGPADHASGAGAAGLPSSSATSAAAAAASTPMSRQSSLGGVTMSRQGTNGSARGRGRRGAAAP